MIYCIASASGKPRRAMLRLREQKEIEAVMVTRIATRTIMVSECFGPTLQGEGALIGKPTIFVRTGGCDYRCDWCDTRCAVLPEHRSEWYPITADEVFAEVQRLSGHNPILVTLSGGNPAMQPLDGFLEIAHAAAH